MGSPMGPILSRFCKDETAATPIEYGVIATLVAILIVGTLRLIGAYLGTSAGGVSQALHGGSLPK
jgi:pilus assembly protein Flp/PilA